MILISSHVIFTKNGKDMYGSSHNFSSYLDKKGINYLFIKHPLYGGKKTKIEGYLNGRCFIKKALGFTGMPFFLRLIQESVISLWYLKQKKPKIFVGVDPLNGVLGIIGRELGWVKKTVYYSVDYAFKRFNNPLLNWGYHLVDCFTALRADQVWNVSRRITEVRKKQEVSHKKNFFVPNSPDFAKCTRLPYGKINKHDLVIVGYITKALDCEIAISAVRGLSSKFADIRLWIIGVGDHLPVLKRFAEAQKVSDRVFFPGQLEHNKLLKFLPSCAVGIALYSRSCAWNRFRDSLKAREYLACGLPVIISDSPSTAEDIKKAKAGLVIKNKRIELEKAVERLFSDKKLYLKMRENGLCLAKEYDFFKIINKRLNELNCL